MKKLQCRVTEIIVNKDFFIPVFYKFSEAVNINSQSHFN